MDIRRWSSFSWGVRMDSAVVELIRYFPFLKYFGDSKILLGILVRYNIYTIDYYTLTFRRGELEARCRGHRVAMLIVQTRFVLHSTVHLRCPSTTECFSEKCAGHTPDTRAFRCSTSGNQSTINNNEGFPKFTASPLFPKYISTQLSLDSS